MATVAVAGIPQLVGHHEETLRWMKQAEGGLLGRLEFQGLLQSVYGASGRFRAVRVFAHQLLKLPSLVQHKAHDWVDSRRSFARRPR